MLLKILYVTILTTCLKITKIISGLNCDRCFFFRFFLHNSLWSLKNVFNSILLKLNFSIKLNTLCYKV